MDSIILQNSEFRGTVAVDYVKKYEKYKWELDKLLILSSYQQCFLIHDLQIQS